MLANAFLKIALETSSLPPVACPALARLLEPCDAFPPRHTSSSAAERARMLAAIGCASLDTLIDETVPAPIRLEKPLGLPAALGESAAIAELREIAAQNRVFRNFIGQGYYDTLTPPVIQRTIFENPGWYTPYTPYQAEVSQGRLEALLNYQTLVTDLTGLDIANASLLDEGTAAAEAMMLCHRLKEAEGGVFFVSTHCHPQTINLVKTRATPLGITVVVGDHHSLDPATLNGLFGLLVQYPDTRGDVHDFSDLFGRAHTAGAACVVATDLLALTLLRSPAEFGADVAIGSAQRFGVPLGFGGPHAAFFATRDAYKRQMPGRLVGVSRDAQGNVALRLSLGTREQHIRRDKATSNICTAQVLLAVMASMYAVYHGPTGLLRIATRIHTLTTLLAAALRRAGATVNAGPVFDTLTIGNVSSARVHGAAEARKINLRVLDAHSVGVSLDEATTEGELRALLACFSESAELRTDDAPSEGAGLLGKHARETGYLSARVFNAYHTEHELLRYIKRLEAKDLSLCHSMVALGSCTMKLNAASEMYPVSWPEFAKLHPFAPADQTRGYLRLARELEAWLCEITGFAAISLQPNAGSQGEYAGLLAIRAYHAARGEGHRDVCLIPTSAHGTNPASAIMGGFVVVPVACDARGNIDVADLRAKAEKHSERLAALMITYPSTHGVFESSILEITALVHAHGGQVYMDGANLNAQVGLTSPARIGADVCHLNLHKTFCIPHGGGGPGVGPVCVAAHLAPYLPGHAVNAPRHVVQDTGELIVPTAIGAVSSAPYGSASILVIPWMFIRMMGAEGLTEATRVAILSANYIAQRLGAFFPVLYRGEQGRVAHECIIDLRGWKKHGIEVEDAAKRLMDYGFHSPTMSWPVAGTLMIEPTESEDQAQLDRFCDALIHIHGEMQAVANGEADKQDNPLKNAPHTALVACGDSWPHRYARELAVYPTAWTRAAKFWPAVGRVDNVYGDRNLVCSCVGMEAYA
ncbi:MAG: glycine dehydrogenase (aminomethyl-transferring) [Verrucomicrobia bacterium]|nr:MAG: glycine dehydrogenase (aminomethyl-transferring) [Verrucomicrobiota bacterium]